ncbi:MAG: hypothetical protein FJ144_07820 [Deltaproteobacteria bacterium]|nr:hypothetical protein [Deltaproteobacteria bacterium]
MRASIFLLLLVSLLGLRLATLSVLPLVDPSEARYATVARDMLQTGNLLTPMVWSNNDYIPFLSKPPLYYWLSSFSMRFFGPDEFASRFPSFLAAIAVLGSTWLVMRRHLGSDVVRSALLVLLSCPLFFFAAGFGLTDVVLTLVVNLALLAFFCSTLEEDLRRKRRFGLVAFACLGVGMIIKGPVSLVLFGLPAALWALWKRPPLVLRGLPWGLGMLLFLLPWAPWFLLAERSNPGFLEYFFVNENFLRYASSSYGDRYGGGHRYPYGAAIFFFLLAVLPWLLLLGWKIRRPEERSAALTQFRAPALQFFLLVIAADVFFLCFSRHILGTYVLPVLPVAALLLAALLATAGFRTVHVAVASAALVTVYSLVLTVGMPLIEGRWSAKSVLDEARAIQQQRHATGQIIFIEKIPFSARFYGGRDVFHLPWDAGNAHYEGYLAPAHGDLFVLSPAHDERLDRYVTDRLAKIVDCGFYSIWQPVLPGTEGEAVVVGAEDESDQATRAGRSESRCFASSSALASASPSSVSWASSARARLAKPRFRSDRS